MFGLDFIRSLKPCKWRYTGDLDDGVEHFGFIAQEVDELTPHEKYGVVKLMPNGYFGLVMTEFIGPMVKAIQEIDERLSRLEAEKGSHDKPPMEFNVGEYKAGDNDPLGNRHDLASNLGDIRDS